MKKVLLFDIEGTTTKISFVHDVLFPYAKEHLASYLREFHQDERIASFLQETSALALQDGILANSLEEQIQVLRNWMAEDRKAPPLKAIQGYVWKNGYETGKFKAHVYDEVAEVLQSLKNDGFTLGIYSSGSVKAQKLLFAHTEYGDLNPLFSFYFDTKVGHKRSSASYLHIHQEIAKQLSITPGDIVFFSDIKEELDAAKEAGFQSIHVLRPGTQSQKDHPTIHTFSELFTVLSV